MYYYCSTSMCICYYCCALCMYVCAFSCGLASKRRRFAVPLRKVFFFLSKYILEPIYLPWIQSIVLIGGSRDWEFPPRLIRSSCHHPCMMMCSILFLPDGLVCSWSLMFRDTFDRLCGFQLEPVVQCWQSRVCVMFPSKYLEIGDSRWWSVCSCSLFFGV